MTIEILVGAKMQFATEIGDDLYLMTDRGLYRLSPEGECCSHCYIQHVNGAWALARGAVISSVENIELPPVPEEEANDVSDVWGHRITTDKGNCSIEMRLDHNGYYGGSLDVSLVTAWPQGVHSDCAEHPELGMACGCLGKTLEDF